MRRFTDEELNLVIEYLQTKGLLKDLKDIGELQWGFEAIRLVNGYLLTFRAFPSIVSNVLVHQGAIEDDRAKVSCLTSSFNEDIDFLESQIKSNLSTN